MLDHQRQKLEERGVLDAGVQLVGTSKSMVLVRLQWRDPESQEPGGLWQLLTLRDGRIIDIQNYRDPRRAQKVMRSRPAQP